MGPIGIPELIIVLVILLVIFGPKRLPGLGRSLGSGMREFKDSISGKTSADEEEDDEEHPRQLEAAAAPPSSVTPAERQDDATVGEPRG
jgi:sec-independent protein translocase protein TatA